MEGGMATTSDGKAIIPGCEPWSAAGDDVGVLVIHGFTGSPQTMRGLAEAFGAAGFTVDLPLLPGHGTSIDDMVTTGWPDWSSAVEAAYAALAARCEKVVVAGLSMGGTLTAWLAARHPEVAGIVLVNPLAVRSQAIVDFATGQLEAGIDRIDAIAGDVADPAGREKAYDATPLAPLVSLQEGIGEVEPVLGDITCPVLLLTAPQDHVVPPTDSDALALAVSGPVERVTLERSYHVATLDYDKDLIAERAVAFARKVTSAG
jgi:carboxylesterase